MGKGGDPGAAIQGRVAPQLLAWLACWLAGSGDAKAGAGHPATGGAAAHTVQRSEGEWGSAGGGAVAGGGRWAGPWFLVRGGRLLAAPGLRQGGRGVAGHLQKGA